MLDCIVAVLIVMCVVALEPVGLGQQTSAYKPDGWQGLTLDKSSPEDAVRLLGQPFSDKTERLQIYNIDAWVSPMQKEKIFRVLTYKNIGDVKQAALAFLDNRLVRIHMKYADNKFPAKDLRERFGVDFVLVEGQVPSNSTPSMYEGQKEARALKKYPAAYYMVGVTPQSMISAFVARGGIKGILEIANDVKRKEPGSLMHLDIISRTLAKR
ncbi:MAG: hypothetical protein ICV60_16645 [Pyrinomonadaceae bacterium]|nr:hypothetical protein [Pyrinomonadaceae bacterium]